MIEAVPPGFSGSAPHWLSLASQWLGWRPSEFWRATPAELIGALRDPQVGSAAAGPTRETIDMLLERERNG